MSNNAYVKVYHVYRPLLIVEYLKNIFILHICHYHICFAAGQVDFLGTCPAGRVALGGKLKSDHLAKIPSNQFNNISLVFQ